MILILAGALMASISVGELMGAEKGFLVLGFLLMFSGAFAIVTKREEQ